MNEPPDPPVEIGEAARLLHDLRQPLAAILAAASALRANRDVDAATQERLLTIIVDNSERLSDKLSDAFGDSSAEP